MLQAMTTTMATRAMNQSFEQFSIADCDRVSPMAIMIGPVTMGGKYHMTRLKIGRAHV